MDLRKLFQIVSDKRSCIDYILHKLDNQIIFYKHGELFLKKKKFNLCKCDRKICKFIADQIIE